MSMIRRMRERSETRFVDSVPIAEADLQRMDDGAAQIHAMSSRAFDRNAEAMRDADDVLVVHDGETVRLESRHYPKIVLHGSGVAVAVPGTTIHTVESYGTGGIAQDPPPVFGDRWLFKLDAFTPHTPPT